MFNDNFYTTNDYNSLLKRPNSIVTNYEALTPTRLAHDLIVGLGNHCNLIDFIYPGNNDASWLIIKKILIND